MKDALRLRPGTPDDFPAIVDLLDTVFHEELVPEHREASAAVFEAERSLVVEDAGAVVAHTNIHSRDFTVPGAIVPAAHVTGVGVLPTHRRQGLMTRMMHRQLRDVAEAGREPIAVLWASETKIYPRFGYGAASARLSFSIMNREVRLPAPPAEPAGQLRMGDPHDLLPAISKVYEQLRPGQVGWSSRDERWWRTVLTDPKDDRDGATKRWAVVHEGSGGPTGYAMWRVKDGWNDYGSNAEVQVREVAAADPETYLALWRFLLGIDLSRSVIMRLASVDEPLQYLVDEPRRLGPALLDGLWVRIVDLPGALAARRYAAPVDVVLDVTDPLLEQNTGRWRLTGGPDGATCERTTDPADLACTVTELGAAYLGATSLAALAAAGRVRQLTGNDPAVAFGWHRMPSPAEVF
ncbi:GNAT family N-acetyltransferase [Actinoplanes sp. GCM10030250]|uniref:GNAT family N-acetyltransferase n=1 Tax=Actinoplanes sp. GCM10030250 TaxID=3273376 RepID=UPI00360A1D23